MAAPQRVSDLVRLGGGREAEIFAWDEGRVLRLARDPSQELAIELEAVALSAAGAAGVPAPAVYERLSLDGRPGAVIERIDGQDLLARLWRRPWSVRAIGRLLGRLHALIHGVTAPGELPGLRDVLVARLSSDLVPADVGERASRLLERLPDGDRLYHGDFHPGNVLGGRAGYRIIDWTNGARADPAADVARTCLLFLAGEVPPDTPDRIRRMDEAGRRMLLRAYLGAYRRERSLDLDDVERWLPVCAAARLAEGIDGEREFLLAAASARDGDGEPPRLSVPGARPLPAPNRRWLVVNALAVTAVVNVVLNAGPAWLGARGADEIPLWPDGLGDTSIVTDTIGTFFILPLVTCVLVTTAVRRELAAGDLVRLGPAGDRVPALRALPRNRLVRGVALGALCVAALAPVAVACLALLGAGPMSVAAFVGYKTVLGAVLGALVTPVIALCAMADAP